MAFRSLAVISLLVIGSGATSTAAVPSDALAAVNTALAKTALALDAGTPVLIVLRR